MAPLLLWRSSLFVCGVVCPLTQTSSPVPCVHLLALFAIAASCDRLRHALNRVRGHVSASRHGTFKRYASKQPLSDASQRG